MSPIYRVLSSILFITIEIDFKAAYGKLSGVEVQRHLDEGKRLLSSGQLNDALIHYHAAVDGDPENFLPHFQRATVFMALGRSKSALPDLDRVLELKPEFYQARLQRGNVLLKQGCLDEAHIDYEAVLRYSPDNPESLQQLSVIEPVKRNVADAKHAIERGDCQHAIELLGTAIEVAPWDPELRLMRAECYERLGDLVKAISDIKPTTKLINDNTQGYLRMSQLHYEMGELEDALREIRECLKLDQDHKECHPFYKKMKKLNKLLTGAQDLINKEEYAAATEKLKKALKVEAHIRPIVGKMRRQLCHCHVKLHAPKEAIKECNLALQLNENDVDALCDRAEAHILEDNFSEAVKDYQKAKNINDQLHKVQEGLERAQRLLKQSKKRDYYKILGIKRNASKKEITKAYRKLAVKWHPDQFKEPQEKKKAEKHFIDIAAAKEVLTDPEKRQKYDNGEDPLDPDQQGGGGWPFQHGGFPFGDGYQFKFHFN
ncbi:dnaJ homolog subfamily C member 3-like [Actinia tenebrosa]|uniref:DnaJ homolog subfamily C member 3-like n=1 Tax=Actinia tenebrosa TaxID=6105 RepID=A0A6P8GZ01_ACTTE|nr:dnaJ homolog subfamily C member 3-like [Actinia tenebrosa]